MSTYLYLECQDHDPPLLSNGEVGQHLIDLQTIRADIANRDLFIANLKANLDVDYGHHFRNNAARFLCQHPKCHIAIWDEYGKYHSIKDDDQ